MTEQSLENLLKRVADHGLSITEALATLRTLPFEDIGFARVDHHRPLRRGLVEAVYCERKTPEQVAQIVQRLAEKSPRLIGTRATPDHFAAAAGAVSDLKYDPASRVLWLDREPDRSRRDGALIVTAGTSDIPVAEEAARTLDLAGHAAPRLFDVGVAGVHRLLADLPALRAAHVIIVVAGMEGALPSVVAGLVAVPVIGVPTSVGYGVSAGGFAALAGMLGGCSPGLAVVNIDNGYGAGCLAAMINSLTAPSDGERS
ncbi:MAG: nickel pincer cofactor biosynthesis protein LarB [Phycisphaerae bacterium]|nr:nickel pincer cofactor biosynthesis protein LarB [Phycisphaerae bacterium]